MSVSASSDPEEVINANPSLAWPLPVPRPPLTLPPLPWQVPYGSMSTRTAAALAEAALQLGRLREVRRGGNVHYAESLMRLASVNGLAAARGVSPRASWPGVGRAMLRDRVGRKPSPGETFGADVLRALVHVDGFHTQDATLHLGRSPLADHARMPGRFASELLIGLGKWMRDAEGPPPMVKAALTTMSLAAVAPEDYKAQVVARLFFSDSVAWVNEDLLPVALDWGLIANDVDWGIVTSVVSSAQPWNPEAVDEAVGEILRIAARALWASCQAIHEVKHHGYTWSQTREATVDALPHNAKALYGLAVAMPAVAPSFAGEWCDALRSTIKRHAHRLERDGLVVLERQDGDIVAIRNKERLTIFVDLPTYYSRHLNERASDSSDQ